jgi:hypothetical protein
LLVPLFLELRGAPADRGGDALGAGDLAEAFAEFGLGRIKRGDDVEADMDAVAECAGGPPNASRLLPNGEDFSGFPASNRAD